VRQTQSGTSRRSPDRQRSKRNLIDLIDQYISLILRENLLVEYKAHIPDVCVQSGCFKCEY